MIIKHDYSYISNNEKKLMDAGYGKMTVHSIHFDRHYTEEQKEKNMELAKSLSKEEWNKHCDQVAESFSNRFEVVLSVFTDRYSIHQVSAEMNIKVPYNSDWDLYFYSNRGWNGKNYMDFFSLSFNENRTPEQNMKLLEEIISLVESLEYENVGCRIQYDVLIDNKKTNEAGKNVCDMLSGKFMEYCGMTGKIKIVSDHDGNIEYGFFKKNARNRYYPISYADILAMNI